MTTTPPSRDRVVTAHPWGQPVGPDHPAYQPPAGRVVAAARWALYAIVLALASTVVAMVIAAALPRTDITSVSTQPAPAAADTFVQGDNDQSRYCGPPNTATEQGGQP